MHPYRILADLHIDFLSKIVLLYQRRRRYSLGRSRVDGVRSICSLQGPEVRCYLHELSGKL